MALERDLSFILPLVEEQELDWGIKVGPHVCKNANILLLSTHVSGNEFKTRGNCAAGTNSNTKLCNFSYMKL